jgi:hypothetical protein
MNIKWEEKATLEFLSLNFNGHFATSTNLELEVGS